MQRGQTPTRRERLTDEDPQDDVRVTDVNG